MGLNIFLLWCCLAIVVSNVLGVDLQAYYGPRVAIPPYFNSAVPPGHAPHPYMWGPPQVLKQTYHGCQFYVLFESCAVL